MRATALVALLVAIAAAAPLWSRLASFGSLPHNDYYGILEQITTDEGFVRDPRKWLAVWSNEHLVIVPALIYAGNVLAAHGDNRVLSGLTLLMMGAVFVLLLGRVPPAWRPTPLQTGVVAAGLAPFVFTPVAAHNVVMGFSGVIWCSSNLFSVVALASLARRADGAPLYPVVVWGGLGSLSYSTSLFVWPALLAAALLARLKKRDVAVLAGAGSYVFLLSALAYHRPEHHPIPAVSSAPALLHYVLAYLGSLFSAHSPVAATIAAAGMTAGVVSGCVAFRHPSPRGTLAFWVGLQLYAVANASAAAVFRLPLGATGHSRYATLAGLFWAAVAGTLLVAISTSSGARARTGWPKAVWALGVALLAVPMYAYGLEVREKYLYRAAYNPVAAQALRLGVPDNEVLKYVSQYPEEIRPVESFMRRVGHVPFNTAIESDAVPIFGARSSIDQVQGHFDRLTRIDDRFARAEGWFHPASGRGVAQVIVLNSRGRVAGRMVTGIPRQDLSRHLGQASPRVGWSGYIKLDSPDNTYSALVTGSGSDLVALRGSHRAAGQ